MQCIVCCDPITIFAVGECNHRDTCYKCMLRKRYFYNDNECPVCKTKLESIIMTKDSSTVYEELIKKKTLIFDDKFKIYFDNTELKDEILSLLSLRCPKCVQESIMNHRHVDAFSSPKALLDHVKNTHHLILCSYCLSGNKLFPCEQQLYAENEYGNHLTNGQQGSSLQVPIEPHPKCKFCYQRFYDKTTLIAHMEKKYPYCILCPKDQSIFYRTKDELWNHYSKSHFVCENPDCKGKDFAIFNTYLDLLAHKRNIHGEKKLVVDMKVFSKSNTNDKKKQNALKEDKQLREEQVDLYIVQDLSGYSESEINKLNEQLVNDILVVFHNDTGKMNRFRKLSRNYLDGTISAVMIHDLYLQLLGNDHIRLISRIISLVPDPSKRHVLEAIFRQAKGRPASILDPEFINSVGGNIVSMNKNIYNQDSLSVHKSKSFNSLASSFVPRSQMNPSVSSEESKSTLLSSSLSPETPSSPLPTDIDTNISPNASPNVSILSPSEEADSSETISKDEDSLPEKVITPLPALPKNLSIPLPVWRSWHDMDCTILYIQQIKQKLINKADISICTFFVSLAQVCVAIIKKLDEILCDKARSKEQWNGISLSTINTIKQIVDNQQERSLGDVGFLKSNGISYGVFKDFDEFYQLYRLNQEPFFRIPLHIEDNDWIIANLYTISGEYLSLFKETFKLIFSSIEQRIIVKVQFAIMMTKRSKSVNSRKTSILTTLYSKSSPSTVSKKGKAHSISPLPSYSEVVKPSLEGIHDKVLTTKTTKTNKKISIPQPSESKNTVSLWENVSSSQVSSSLSSSKVTQKNMVDSTPVTSSTISTISTNNKPEMKTPQESFPTLSSVYKNESHLIVDPSLQKIRNVSKYNTSRLTFNNKNKVIKNNKKKVQPVATIIGAKEMAPDDDMISEMFINKNASEFESNQQNHKSIHIDSHEEFPSLNPSYKPSKNSIKPKSKSTIVEETPLSFLGYEIHDKLTNKELKKIEKQFKQMDKRK